jgi:hypothetical protein
VAERSIHLYEWAKCIQFVHQRGAAEVIWLLGLVQPGRSCKKSVHSRLCKYPRATPLAEACASQHFDKATPCRSLCTFYISVCFSLDSSNFSHAVFGQETFVPTSTHLDTPALPNNNTSPAPNSTSTATMEKQGGEFPRIPESPNYPRINQSCDTFAFSTLLVTHVTV